MEEYINYLYMVFMGRNSICEYNDPIVIAESEILKNLGEREQEIYNNIQEQKHKKNLEKIKKALEFGFLNAKDLFK